jgi:chromosome segregation ATPase
MESEKVKEIKTALERCKTQTQSDCRKCPYGENPRCLDLLIGNSLTYINELESENERLKTSEFNSCQELDNASNQIHSLEDRIAELEKENAKLLDSVETVQSNRCTTK